VPLGKVQLRPASGRPQEQAAFADIYRENHAAVHGYLRARLLNAGDAEDLCQEVFLRAYRGLRRYDPTASIRPWLLGIGRNVLHEHVRRVRKRKEVAWTELCLELEETVESEGLYEDILHLLPICTVRLGESARQAIAWHYTRGEKLREIAARLDKSLGAVKVLMVRARQALRRCIQSYVGGNPP
jgi:RNA polymerase sigma-70 factor (ECF subfamily)